MSSKIIIDRTINEISVIFKYSEKIKNTGI